MSRLGFYGRKLILAALTIVGAVVCLFLLLEFVPGNLVDAVLGTNATPELRAALAEKMGLDQPFYVRMSRFLLGAVRGDFGMTSSRASRCDHADAGFAVHADACVQLTVHGPAFRHSSGLPGRHAARLLGRPCPGMISIAFIAVPNFVVSIALLLIFSLSLHLLPVAGAGEPGNIGDQLLHLILPTVALSLGWIGYVARILRATLLEVLAEPHIRTLRAYGVGRTPGHLALCPAPALVPLVAILGLGLGDLISGAIFAEIIFARPGLGSLISHAVSARNYPVVQAGSLVVVVFYIAANTCADLAGRPA